jgi:dienelactone hydrolase
LLLALLAVASAAAVSAEAGAGESLPGTQSLTMEGDLAEQMVSGIDHFLTRETGASVARRASRWKRDFSSQAAYSRSGEPNRERLRTILGAADPRVAFSDLELTATVSGPAVVAEARTYKVLAVRWPVLAGVDGEGLLLVPNREPTGDVIALPDCDWTPEMLAGLAEGVPPEAQYARRLAESGCRVLAPMLIDRRDTYSGNPEIRMTNQPHREFIYRAAFEMGRHLIGYEVQKVLAAVDWFERDRGSAGRKVGVFGYGEGGLLALYSAALDERIDAAVVSGYFGPREELWREPIYRNVWGLLEEFGDAELATLIAPRALLVEHCPFPRVDGPPPPREGRSGAASGAIRTPSAEAVTAEAARAQRLAEGLQPEWRAPVVLNTDGKPGGAACLAAFLQALGAGREPAPPEAAPQLLQAASDPEARFKRQFDQLVAHTQTLMREGDARRREFWARADPSSPETWRESCRPYRDYLWDEVIGRFPASDGGPEGGRPRTRLIYDEPKYRGYEAVLEVGPDVFAYGILLVPKEMGPGERRPVVVCQHGLEGRPQDVADAKVDSPYYHRFAARLAEEGFVTFSPQNPYIGMERFRTLQRKANPLKLSLFAVIVAQHQRALQWLAALPFVDPERMAFYGLSYGGKTAMRVPALLEDYCLSICSGDFNEWIWKNVSIDWKGSYMFTGEWEMPEWDLGNTFNYAEMSWLICPRPFMVERGHDDGCAPSEWVGYEFTKTRERYDRLGIGDRAEIEFFNGPHTIHGVGTFAFLRRHLAR